MRLVPFKETLEFEQVVEQTFLRSKKTAMLVLGT